MIPPRLNLAARQAGPRLGNIALWLLKSREYTNFTYNLDEINRDYLVAFVAQITGKSYVQVNEYIAEIENDDALRRHILQTTKSNVLGTFADPVARYGRRLGWYGIVRARKPTVVVETGVDKGLGSCVLTAALARNAAEGHEGCYYGVDINPDAGYLLSGHYARHGRIIYGDAVAVLKAFSQPVDLFINDSDHSPSYEAAEYQAVGAKLREKAIILSDNAHKTAELLKFANQTGRRFLFFQEKPLQHWYPGAGIGAAFDGL